MNKYIKELPLMKNRFSLTNQFKNRLTNWRPPAEKLRTCQYFSGGHILNEGIITVDVCYLHGTLTHTHCHFSFVINASKLF